MPILYRLTCFITNLCNNRKIIWPNIPKTRRNRPSTPAWVNPAHSIKVKTCILLIRRHRARVEQIMGRRLIWPIWVNRLLAICILTYRTNNSNKRWPSTSSHQLLVRWRISRFYTRIRCCHRSPKVRLGRSCLKTRSSTRVSKISIMDHRKFLPYEVSPKPTRPHKSCTQIKTFLVNWLALRFHQILIRMVVLDWGFSNRVLMGRCK